MRNSSLAIDILEGDFENAEIVLLHEVRFSIPVVYDHHVLDQHESK